MQFLGDSAGNTQPEQTIWNLRGVMNNAYHRITINGNPQYKSLEVDDGEYPSNCEELENKPQKNSSSLL